MNKYQEALEIIGNLDLDELSNGYDNPKYLKDFYYGEYDILHELVEKATPRTPEYVADGYADGALVYDTWICPNCGTSYEVDYDEYDYCPNCGQCIDRSESEDE